MTYHAVTNQIIDLLKKNNFWFETFEHEDVRTSKEAAKTRIGFTLSQGAKAIIIRIKLAAGVKKFIMLVLPGDKRFDIDKVKSLLSTKDIRFAAEEEVIKITNGILPGGVPPFGNLFSLDVYTDEGLFVNEKIVFNAADRGFSIAMKSKDYISLVNPVICNIT